ncbi:hypothetical protein AVEN_12984-1 [Araneus ventricosus]|uniref:Uncharacterized protein n=1 Tax=Araneus ventricosus TaxID=182803 RepID=A0A4Y2QK76_ARAVE|nr:hypothetical protein AVEN_12984-1 [Araneus ventricosus]
MVYGENLCLPSQFFVQQQPQAAENGFIKKLKIHIQQLRNFKISKPFCKTYFCIQRSQCVFPCLSVCGRCSLSQPYTGPYKVLSRTNKNFIILKDNKKVTVTIDRLKPAHLLLDNVNSSESKHDSPGVDTPSSTPSAKEPEKSNMPLCLKNHLYLRVYSGTPCWVGRRHFFRTFTTGKVTSTNPTGGTRIDLFVSKKL